MPLKEYEYGDRTYLFDEDRVPEGAKLVTDKEVTADSVNLFPDMKAATKAETEKTTTTPKAGRKPANKAAPAPKNKGDVNEEPNKPSDETNTEVENKTEDAPAGDEPAAE